MKLVVLHNPKSGKGRASHVSRLIGDAYERLGHDVHHVEASARTNGSLARTLDGARALIVVGGDGTVHNAAEALVESGAPVYHVPLGTENLFAREFSMNRDLERLHGAIEQGAVLPTDAARWEGDGTGRMLIMCSVGADAGVIHRVCAARRGAISHLTYAKPVVAELLSPRQRRLTIVADGKRIVDAEPGIAVVANMRQYATRIDPANRADPTDGLLDVVFFRAETSLTLANWLLSARLRMHHQRDDLVYLRAKHVQIESPDGPVPMQVDGEAPPVDANENGATGFARTPVSISVEPRAMRVLLPVHRSWPGAESGAPGVARAG